MIGAGEQPHISRDARGIIRVVFGEKNKVYCATSTDNGGSFSTPALVAEIPGMHLGMSRGPQIASSVHYSVITAMDKTGNIHWFRLNHSGGSWKDMGTINDVRGSAPEGLMGLAADMEDDFCAVWLDFRRGKRNQVYFSRLTAKGGRWSSNTLLYRSPDGHVCECCKPSVYASGKQVAVMFRNWLNGSRDLYLMRSQDEGQSFDKAERLGENTWKLDACPMDGGGVTIDASGVTHTAWERKGSVFYCQPGDREELVGNGRECSIAYAGRQPVVSMQTGDTLEVFEPLEHRGMVVGNGGFLQSIPISDNTIACVWEADGAIRFKKVNLGSGTISLR